ncbi:MAG: nuclear transport factor 2 family protein, partial [Pseudonocardiaceae bacterium]
PDVATTRHWVNNLLMEKAGDGAQTICYIIAMDIGRMPSTIARTGLYTDDLTKLVGGWRYTNRTLALDPNSPPPS